MPTNALPNARRCARGLLAALVCLAACVAVAADSAYPLRPVRFIVPDENGNLIDLIKNSMLKFHMEKEFGKKSA